MKRTLALVTALILGWFGQLAIAQVSTDYDRSVDFTRYHSYAFAKPSVKTGNNPIYNSPLLLENIQGNLARELKDRGLTYQKSTPDLLVKVHTYTENKTRNVLNSSYPYAGGFFPYRFGFWPYWGGYYGGQTYCQENYTQGTLLVDMIDARTNKLLWRGAVQGVVDNPKRLERQVARGVRKIMKDYPVKAS
ncbi:DUF4136 domain-containing protein [Spirosoma knui]